MEHLSVSLLLSSLIISFYMAWNIGASDVANAMGTSVGSGSLSLKQAVIIAAFLELTGAFFFGDKVSDTIQTSIIDISYFKDVPVVLSIGMLSTLLSAGLWLQIASFFGLPVSTTHTIVGAMTGFGIITIGPSGISWTNIAKISSTWILSPICGGAISFALFYVLRQKIFYSIHPLLASRKIVPLIYGVMFCAYSCTCMLYMVSNIYKIITVSLFIGIIAFCISRVVILRMPIRLHRKRLDFNDSRKIRMKLEKTLSHLHKVKELAKSGYLAAEIERRIKEVESLTKEVSLQADREFHSVETKDVEKIFSSLQILSAGIMALAHGANDVSNAVAPVTIILNQASELTLLNGLNLQKYMLLWGGIGIVIGLATWGWRVIQTMGKKITELTPTRGFAAEFGCSLTVMLASYIKMPVSTTHVLVGSILGVGMARGIGAINLSAVKTILLSWIITIPAGAVLSSLSFVILQKIFV